MQELTKNSILNGKITLFQPKNGYRIAIDPIILAYFTKTKHRQTVLDVGCGVGAVSLILKQRDPSLEIVSIDIDREMCRICEQNSEINSLRLNVINTGIQNPMLETCLFDHVVTNPPYFDAKSSRTSDSTKLSKFETLELSEWIKLCIKRLKDNGMFTIIHDASRVDEIIYALKSHSKNTGNIEIRPIFSKHGTDARRVVLSCRKNSRKITKITSGLIVHNDNNSYSETMEMILSGGATS